MSAGAHSIFPISARPGIDKDQARKAGLRGPFTISLGIFPYSSTLTLTLILTLTLALARPRETVCPEFEDRNA